MPTDHDDTITAEDDPDEDSSSSDKTFDLAHDDTLPSEETTVDTSATERGDDADSLAGERLDHFDVEAPIGAGGMGSVYRAHDTSLDRTVALKVLPPDFDEPRLLQRFKREARAQARLSHPNVVPIYFIGEDHGRHYFAMELVEGNSLDELVERREKLHWRQALELMDQVVDALEHAHQQDLIHRDLKPGNLLVTPDGTVKVADFGLAKPIEEGEGQLTEEGVFLGTPAYVAPEQAKADDVDHRADMYALGATFFHLVAGRPVFTASTPMAIAIKQVSEPPPSLSEAAPELDIPSEFKRLLSQLLAKDPDHRFRDYAELREAIDAARPHSEPRAGLLVRTLAWIVDLSVVGIASALTHPAVFYAGFPLYLIAAWALDRPTLGNWLFRLRVRRSDGSSLTPARALLRFALMHWGLLLLIPLSAGIGAIGTETREFELAGGEGSFEYPTTDILALDILFWFIAALLIITPILWLLGGLIAAFHPRKQTLHDLLADTGVTYRFDDGSSSSPPDEPY